MPSATNNSLLAFIYACLGISIALIIAVAILSIIVSVKNKKVALLQQSFAGIQKTYADLDNQAKLILKTDLELHNTQSELDKKIVGLYTLHKISRILSTTLDENEIFNKISQEYLSELGFDKAVALLVQQTEADAHKALEIKLTIGFTEAERTKLLSSAFVVHVFEPVIKNSHIISSIDKALRHNDLQATMKACDINSFVCAPITGKEGIMGALFVGSESAYSQLTLGDKEIVSILASQIGQAIENARLFEQTWRSHQELEVKVQERTKELSDALEEIRIITKRKSDFVSAVAHELRTPLTSIKGYAALLSEGKLGEVSPGVKERLEKINKHSDDLSHLINNLLDISRIESGRVEMKIEPLNLRELLDGIADLFAPQIKEKQINFRCQIAHDAVMVPADKDQLRRVFINLISNALKFTPSGGSISVNAEKKKDTLQLCVSDTGRGIEEKNFNKVFEEFYREDNDINQKVKGTGLGLSLVKYIIEAHRGTIWVESQFMKGSNFYFTLPLAPVNDGPLEGK